MRSIIVALFLCSAAMAQTSVTGPPRPPAPPVPQPIDPVHQPPKAPTPKAPLLPLAGTFRPNEVLVKFHNSIVPVGLAQALSLSKVVGVGGAGWHRLTSTGGSTEGLVVALSARADVDYVEPNYIVHGGATPDDTYWSATGCQTPDPSKCALWNMPRISAPASWDINTGSRTTVVGVVDSGIYYNHPDLVGSGTIDNVWSAPQDFTVTIGGQQLTCGASSHGFNAIKFSSNQSGACDPLEDQWHGTHVSGIIGAIGDNSTGVVGVNWAVSLMGLKFLDSSDNGTVGDAINAIEFAVQVSTYRPAIAQLHILNNSWYNSPDSQALQAEIKRAASNDILFVAIAGNSSSGSSNNDSSPNYPGNYSVQDNIPNVVTVANTDSGDNLASGSNYGATSVQLAAPRGSPKTGHRGSLQNRPTIRRRQ